VDGGVNVVFDERAGGMLTLFPRGDRIDRKGSWTPTHDGGRALVCCPECRWVGTLAHYKVSTTGSVRPMYVCPGPHCKWDGHIGLEGWVC
jgi:hypothetical protein